MRIAYNFSSPQICTSNQFNQTTMKQTTISIETARAMYEQGGTAKEFALENFTETELQKPSYPKQTAVDWLISQFEEYGYDGIVLENVVEQVKQMEKEQIKNAWYDGISGGQCGTSEEYYNETYGGNNSEITMNNQSSTFPYVCASCNKEMVAGGFPKWFCLQTTCKNYLKPITK